MKITRSTRRRVRLRCAGVVLASVQGRSASEIAVMFAARECTQLLARVRQVRDELARQEQQIAQRRAMLDRYLSGTAAPAGLSE